MFYSYCILFFIFSFLGWVMEVTLTLITDKKFVNRGFLLGPCCPIYGCGCILLNLLLQNYVNNIIVLFILTMFTCSLLEYITSFLMEKIFKLRWWDYSQMRFNINGRICLETMTPFSILGVLAIKYATPFFITNINKLSEKKILIISIILITLFIIDVIISLTIVFKLKFVSKNIKKDSTLDIKNAIKKFIKNDIYVYERIIESFPNLTKSLKEKALKLKKKSKITQ
ncbi:putative membrane protein [Firmicutes bacterium CAG:460]|nr:putative membrane protein [Firmicutes bacterium CAG:460]